MFPLHVLCFSASRPGPRPHGNASQRKSTFSFFLYILSVTVVVLLLVANLPVVTHNLLEVWRKLFNVFDVLAPFWQRPL